MEWISVEDRLPEDVALIWYDGYLDGNAAVAWYDLKGKSWFLFHWEATDDPIAPPTHWMPLPEPPKTN